nr:restriction endonuclease subunit S [uncultured Erwinia sp.]
MSFEWKVAPLGEIASNVSRTFNLKNKDTVVFVNTGDVSNGEFLHFNKVNVKGLPGQAKKSIKNKDILYSEIRPGNKRYVFVESSSTEDFVVSTKFMVLEAKGPVIPEYLYLVLTSQECEAEFKVIADSRSGTFPQITFDSVSDYPVKYPLHSHQKKIVKFDTAFKKKVKINNQINQTLEKMAQALFKSWFVDFEPIKAKISVLVEGGSQEDATLAAMTAISGKDSDALVVFKREHPEQHAELKATAELFPSMMQESELGNIPEGWRICDLSNVASLNTESWSKKNAPESLSYVDLANTKWGIINSVEVYKFSDAPSRARRILKPCDTIIGTVRPGNGSYAYISKSGLTGSTGFAVLTPKARVFSEYIYLCVTSKESIERLAHLADGGAYPAVNAEVVLSTQCVLPLERKKLESLLKMFSSRTEVFFSYRANNLDQNEVLTSIRDTLLPKLLSGEITLPEAEHVVSEVENV